MAGARIAAKLGPRACSDVVGPHVAEETGALARDDDDSAAHRVKCRGMPMARIGRRARWVNLGPLLVVDGIRPQVVAVARSVQPTEHEDLPAYGVIRDRRVDSGARRRARSGRKRPPETRRLVVRAGGEDSDCKKDDPHSRRMM